MMGIMGIILEMIDFQVCVQLKITGIVTINSFKAYAFKKHKFCQHIQIIQILTNMLNYLSVIKQLQLNLRQTLLIAFTLNQQPKITVQPLKKQLGLTNKFYLFLFMKFKLNFIIQQLIQYYQYISIQNQRILIILKLPTIKIYHTLIYCNFEQYLEGCCSQNLQFCFLDDDWSWFRQCISLIVW
ncbi:unnamed protein product [Paramecium pentaurelia]|uniref:Uncharacterized protein n=1 Tax=Paramecium pentaurelia TaxID=43138 RepID=A0A8S1SN83_9CILI|nr:unnamed protein product [Paramecium pentaurelia]